MGDAGDSIKARNSSWSFGGDVSEHFDAHVEKSVPLYHEGHDLVAKLSDFFLNDGSTCYELGCSTGALSAQILARNAHRRIQCIGVDIEPSMVDKARERCAGDPNFTGIVGDMAEIDFEPADLIVAYYTIQFTRPRNRQLIFDRLYETLNWGGALVLFEKVRAPDARFQDMMTASSKIYNAADTHTPRNPKSNVDESRYATGASIVKWRISSTHMTNLVFPAPNNAWVQIIPVATKGIPKPWMRIPRAPASITARSSLMRSRTASG